MKVTSFWYRDGDGADLHNKDKQLLTIMLRNKESINVLRKLVIKKHWVDTKDERLTKSMVLVGKVRDEFIREIPKLLRGVGWINKMAIQKLADMLYVLHKTDDMYYERFGFLIWRLIEIQPRWIATDKVGRIGILKEEMDLYFTYEHREDRVPHLKSGWEYLIWKYTEDEGIERCVNWLVQTFWEHREEYDREEVSLNVKLKAFYPENWFPVGRGQMWDMIHGGRS